MEIGEWGIYGLNGWGIYGLNEWHIYDLVGWGSYGIGLSVGATTGFGIAVASVAIALEELMITVWASTQSYQ